MTSNRSRSDFKSLFLWVFCPFLAGAAIAGNPPVSPPGRQILRPLDPKLPAGQAIPIYYEFYRHSGPGRSIGTIVATEGGPGYPATLSREDYLALFRPLLEHRDFLLMDNRGTGQSAAVDCPALQHAAKLTTRLIGECGRLLGPRAYLFSTALAADDLAAILDSLNIGKIDLYGNSYGTYFEQTFAVLHPEKLRSVILDGAYPLTAADYAWYPNYAPATREKFNLACRRSAHCARIPGDSIAHILPALQQLRARPFAASAVTSDGERVNFTADAAALATVMFGAAPPYATLRETDAAARAFAAGDHAPLLRLMADSLIGTDSRDPSGDPKQWSSGLAVAVTCGDAPQIFDMNLAVGQRRAQFLRIIGERQRSHPETYAPFTIDEFRGLPLDYAFIEQCLEWPPPSTPPPHPASQVVPPGAKYPAVPALIISGEYDNMTSIADAAIVAAAFPLGRHLIIANGFHVNALPRGRSECAAGIARHFVANLDPGETSCAADVPAIRLAPDFAWIVAQVDPADALKGNTAGEAALRCANAAVRTAGDVVARLHSNTSGHGIGLRGGTFTVQNLKGTRIEHVTLNAVRWTNDFDVSGELDWSGPRGEVTAHLSFGPRALCGGGDLRARWPQMAAHARASIAGLIGGATVIAESDAP